MRRMNKVLELAAMYVDTGSAAVWDDLESWWLCAETEVGAAQLKQAFAKMALRGVRAEHVRALARADQRKIARSLRF